MADTKISNMPAASALSGAELVAGVQSGTNVKITAAQIATLADAAALVIGTTPITSGTTGRLLYDNAAVLGEALLTYSAAVLQLGAADATTPVTQTLKAQSGLTGSGSNIGGPDFTIQPGLGTGFGTTATYGLGRILFSTPVQQATGATIQTYATAVAIGPQTITSAVSNPVLALNQTWNNSGLAATGILLNITNTASSAAAKLIDLQVGGTTRMAWVVTPASNAPNLVLAPGTNANDSVDIGSAVATQGLRMYGGTSYTAGPALQIWPTGSSFQGMYFDAGSSSGADILFRSSPSGTAALTIKQGNGSLVCNAAAIATNATDGFLYIATCAGTPTGTPTGFTGRVALVYDTSAHQFWIYDGGWKQPKTPAAAAIITWQ